MSTRPQSRLTDLVGDHRQLASVRLVELQDGAERGLRVLMFSTGGGLDFWVLADRNLDIGTLNWRGIPVAWHHPEGYVHPSLHDRYGDRGTSIERVLGGFLITCGLENVRQPRDGAPLHGTYPMRPARLVGHGENWNAARPSLFAEGEVVTAHMRGEGFRLRRRIEAEIGGNSFEITDVVENIGTERSQMMILYHTNFGFPVVGDGTTAYLGDQAIIRRGKPGPKDAEHVPSVVCRRVSGKRFCSVVARPAYGSWEGFSATLEGSATSLPYVQYWEDFRPRRNILAVEPANCDRNEDGTSGEGTWLEPGESWASTLRFSFSGCASRPDIMEEKE